MQGAANYTSMLEHRSTLRCFAFGGVCAAGGYALANLLPRGQGATPADNTLQASAPTSIHLRTRHLTGPVFIVGSGHCGTTLMCRLIDAHRDICCGPESEVFVRNPNRSVDHLLLTTKSYEATANSLVQWQKRKRHRVIERVLHSHCAARKPVATRWAEKTPTHVHHLAVILQAFPNARVVLMVRDGFDTVCSLVRRARKRPDWQRRYDASLMPDPNADIALMSADRWVADNLADSKWVDDPRVMLVRLEDLAANVSFAQLI